MKHHYGWIIILLGALAIACTKQYTAPAQWFISITRTDSIITPTALSTAGPVVRYNWNGTINAPTYTLKPGRNEIQLTAFDDKGNSRAEYYTIVR